MKSIIVLLSIFSAIFFFGCHENQITEPINTLDKTSDYLGGGVINLNSPIANPITGKSEIRGVVRYKMLEGLSNAQLITSYKGANRVKLIIEMDAELHDLTGSVTARAWPIKGSSTHHLVFQQDKFIKIHKSYAITGREDIRFIVVFGVEAYKVSILNMYIREL